MSEQSGTIAITGSNGRVGRALMRASTRPTLGWRRPDFDLDRPDRFEALLSDQRPDLVIHTAAMTDVDACAQEPDVAMRRNGEATGLLAAACRAHGVKLVVISSNEVFDGERPDGRGYREDDEARPRNPYGASKWAGEKAARSAFTRETGLWIVRTAWLYGPPGPAFPEKIVAAADRLEPGEALPVVDDEYGTPTLAADLADAILALLGQSDGGIYHLVNQGVVSRLGWARGVLAQQRPERHVRPISRAEFVRASDPPSWAVLDSSRARALGIRLRSWQTASEEYLGNQAD